MSDVFICDSCGQELELQKDFGIKKRGVTQREYRIRRFYCSLCDIPKTLFGNGFRDENFHPPHYFRNMVEKSNSDINTPSKITYV